MAREPPHHVKVGPVERKVGCTNVDDSFYMKKYYSP